MKIQDPYAKYREYPKIPYKIIELLLKDERAEELLEIIEI